MKLKLPCFWVKADSLSELKSTISAAGLTLMKSIDKPLEKQAVYFYLSY